MVVILGHCLAELKLKGELNERGLNPITSDQSHSVLPFSFYTMYKKLDLIENNWGEIITFFIQQNYWMQSECYFYDQVALHS